MGTSDVDSPNGPCICRAWARLLSVSRVGPSIDKSACWTKQTATWAVQCSKKGPIRLSQVVSRLPLRSPEDRNVSGSGNEAFEAKFSRHFKG
jgi:hypothetical protein